MSRDHYPGVPKKIDAYVDKDGNVKTSQVKGDSKRLVGTATLTGGTVTITDARLSENSFALLTPQHDGPTDVNWGPNDGSMTFSGTGDGTVAYEIIL